MCVTLRTALQWRPAALGQHVHVGSTNRLINSLQAWHVFLIAPACLTVCLSVCLSVGYGAACLVMNEPPSNGRGGALVQSRSLEQVITLRRAALSSLWEDRAHLCMYSHICTRLHRPITPIHTHWLTDTSVLTYTLAFLPGIGWPSGLLAGRQASNGAVSVCACVCAFLQPPSGTKPVWIFSGNRGWYGLIPLVLL